MCTRRALLSGLASAFGAGVAHAQSVVPPLAEPLVAYHVAQGGRALCIARNGVVRIESYTGGRAMTAPIRDASSSFVSLLAAALVADRILDLDEPVSRTITEFQLSPLKSRILVRHLLARTSAIPMGPTRTAAEAILLEPTGLPGETFDPTDAGLELFCDVARRKLAVRGLEPDPADYLERRVLGPIGAQAAYARGDDGFARLWDGVETSAPSWLAIGELFRRGGVWRARWLVDSSTISECSIGNTATSRAGLGWWLGSGAPLGPDDPLRAVSDLWQYGPGLPSDLMMAAGKSGNRLYVLPTRRIVAARLADPAAPETWSDVAFLRHLLATL